MSERPDHERRPLEQRLEAAVLRARLALFWERLWPGVAGFLSVAAAFAAASWFGLWLALPPLWRIPVLIGFAAAAVLSLLPLARIRIAPRDAALRRLERRSGLDHRPLAALSDTLGGSPDASTRTLWETHRRRMAERLGRLSAGAPSPRLDRRDPFALRAVALLLFVAGFFYAGGDRIGRILGAFETLPVQAAAALRVDAWIAPPAYTGRPPIVLTSGGEQERVTAPVSVPQKSTVVVRVEGGQASVDLLAEDGSATPAETHAATGGRLTEYRAVLEKSATVRVIRGESRTARWSVSVEPDRVPVISFAKDPETLQSGALKLAYTIEDDYGVVDAETRFEPLDNPSGAEARPLYGPPVMRLSLPHRRAKAGTAETLRDLTDHPWAGAKVRLTLAARDEADQWGLSEAREFTLPARRFTKPLARAVIEQRRMLAIDANATSRVIRALDALMIDPEKRIGDVSVYLGLSTAAWRLKGAKDDDTLRSVVDHLWQVALAIENGDLSIAERDLRAAEEALRKALEDGASDAEIEKLMQQLREAMNRYLNELMAEMQRRPPLDPREIPPDARTVSPQDLERMLQQLENLAKSGARDAARELLAQLQNMLENLQNARPMPGDGGQQSQMGQALDKLGDMIREQQRLMNETFRRGQQGRQGQSQQGQQQGRQGQQGRRGQQGQQGQQGQGQQGQGDLAEALRQLQQGQGALREQLQQLLDQLGQMGAGDNRQLGEAGQAMGEAERALGQGAPGEAVDDQAQALDHLRRGAQSLQQQLADQMGPGQRGPMRQGGYADDDPLGRPRRNEGYETETRYKVPDEIDVQRARRILEELRRRLSDPGRPRLELDYLERLLRQF